MKSLLVNGKSIIYCEPYCKPKVIQMIKDLKGILSSKTVLPEANKTQKAKGKKKGKITKF